MAKGDDKGTLKYETRVRTANKSRFTYATLNTSKNYAIK